MAALLVDISPVVGDGTPPAAGANPVPGRVCVLDAGVPWVRVAAELRRELERLNSSVERLAEYPGRPYAELPARDQYALGARAAAAWTLSVDGAAPMCRRELVVSGQAIRDELERATAAMRARGETWVYATGVVFWLLWITGGSEDPPDYGFSRADAAER